jgi:hypothetical protein
MEHLGRQARVPSAPRVPVPAAAARCAATTVAVALLTSALLAFTAPGAASAADPRGVAAHARHVSVTVGPQPAVTAVPVPQSFIGLSFELSSLPLVARYGESGDLVAMLRSLGPGVLRFGGVSADSQVAWTDAQTPRPAWAASVINADDLRALAVLAQRSGWRVLLTIGFGHPDIQAAVREVRAASSILGPSLEAIELGNEPNAYAAHALRSEPWTYAQYGAEASAYEQAIAAGVPGVPLAGPDVTGSRAFDEWGTGEAVNLKPALLTGHHYPLGCHQKVAPSISRLLSPRTRRRELRSIQLYMRVARGAAIPFRLDEANSVSCGGTPGISDTFASSLWALDYTLQTMAAGMAGINFHAHPANCTGYSPVCATTPAELSAGTLHAQPEWYALLLARSLIGDRPLSAAINSGRPRNADVIAMLAPYGAIHLVVIDYEPPGSKKLALKVHLSAGFGAATVLSLRASSRAAKSAVALGGAVVAADGSFTPPPARRLGRVRGGTLRFTVSPSSAQLITVYPLVPPVTPVK